MKALKLAGVAIAAVIVVIALLLVIGIPSGFLTAQIEERSDWVGPGPTKRAPIVRGERFGEN